MNKHVLSAMVILSFAIYALSQQTDTLDSIEKIVVESTETEKGLYKDGVYTGKVVDAIYGNVETQATVQNGHITQIEFLQYPDHHGYSKLINPEALPYLASEAIKIQSAQVDIFSGATQTSKAFIESLGSALDQAKI